jgi:hypothetical protein
MADPKFPYVKWRDGRPRAVHGPRQRKRGFVDQDLKHDDGSWFTMEECAAFSDKRVREVKESRSQSAAAHRARAAAMGRKVRNTVADLLDDWMASDAFRGLAKATKLSYVKGANALLWKPETREEAAARKRKIRAGLAVTRRREGIADRAVAAIGKPEFRALFEYLVRERGAHMAHATIATLSAAITWGTESTRWRLAGNPRLDMEFEAPPGRVVLVTMREFSALVDAFDAIERPSIGDGCYLGLFTGQRQGDRLSMKDESAVEGRHAFRQRKTGELVDIKEAPQLAARLDAARVRVAAIKLRLGLKDMPAQIVINEENGRPYADKTYGNWFAKGRAVAIFGCLDHMTPAQAIERAEDGVRELRAAWVDIVAAHPIDPDMKPEARERAIEGRTRAVSEWLAEYAGRSGDRAWRVAPCPSLAFINPRGHLDLKHDQDLRDTCVMLLDRAGCDLLTICDITGHSYASAQTIVRHYRARNAERADAGIDRLVLQVRKEGMAG